MSRNTPLTSKPLSKEAKTCVIDRSWFTEELPKSKSRVFWRNQTIALEVFLHVIVYDAFKNLATDWKKKKD